MAQLAELPTEVPLHDLRAAAAELEQELTAAARRVLASGRYIAGDELAAFEEEWADYCGSQYCVGVGNGLDAISLALRGLGIGVGDEVLVPSFTFIATWLAVSAVGATPIPVEPDPVTANIDPERLDAAVSPATRAVIAVHLYGQPADLDAVGGWAERHGIAMIQDAAQAHGARWRGQPLGALGQLAAFSFYPTKNLGAYGDGGAVVSDDESLVQRIRAAGNYGSVVEHAYDVLGVNSRLDSLQAALLRVKLGRLSDWNKRRTAVAESYLDQLRDLPWLELPRIRPQAESAWHLFVVRCEYRDELRHQLAARGVETGLHYPVAPHRTPAYASRNLKLPVAERLAACSLSLPIGPHLERAQVDTVVDGLRAFIPGAARWRSGRKRHGAEPERTA